MANAKAFLSHYIGEQALETLAKGEMFKENTATALDYDEIYKATQIVPKTVLSLLHKELHDLKENEHVEFPFKADEGKDAQVYVQKFSGDNYSGHISRDGKVLARFRNRSLPGVGIILLSTFELYDFDESKKAADPVAKPEQHEDLEQKINKLIDERLSLHSIVRKVVDQTMSEREALESLISKKLGSMIKEDKKPKEELKHEKIEKSEDKKQIGHKLKEFLNSRKSQHKPKVFLVKSESSMSCPDCGQVVFENNKLSGCVCCGDNHKAKVFVKKNQDGTMQVKFSKDWDQENISVLLETFKKKRVTCE